jgi:uncharacterized protein (DUF2141 family)
MRFEIIVIFLLSLAALSQEETSILTVKISDIENSDGTLLVSVFSPDDDWLKETYTFHRLEVDMKDGVQSVDFTGLEPGTYAVSIIHDQNNNGELDSGMFHIPKEPYGFSNDAKGRMGPPGFDDCKFEYDGGLLEVQVTMRN